MIKWRNSYTSCVSYIRTQTCISLPSRIVDCCMFLFIIHAEIVLCNFSFVMLPCDVIFMLHCSLKSADLVIQAALIKKISVKDRSPLTPQIISHPKFLVHPCEFVPFINKVLPVGIGSYCSFISNIDF